MGSHDSVKICDLIGLFILDPLNKKFPTHTFRLYRDDGLCLSRNCNGHILDKLTEGHD